MGMTVKDVVRQFCPPILWSGAAALRRRAVSEPGPLPARCAAGASPSEQDLAIYWDEEWAEILEHWGEGNAWSEIQLLMMNCRGKVLDVACGTGRTMSILARFADIEITGCDISDMLIGKARDRGIDPERLVVGDATRIRFPVHSFTYSVPIDPLHPFSSP